MKIILTLYGEADFHNKLICLIGVIMGAGSSTRRRKECTSQQRLGETLLQVVCGSLNASTLAI